MSLLAALNQLLELPNKLMAVDKLQSKLNANIFSYCEARCGEFDQISEHRKSVLQNLVDYLMLKYSNNETPKVIVICTHNSRRSHFGQLWLAVGSEYYKLPPIQTYSGGTEATAFNIRAVEALKTIGFQIETVQDGDNPVYAICWNRETEAYKAFSKRFDDAPNPTSGFAAVMVCSEADEGCPFVPGCDFRISIPYEDPKAFDGTPLEREKYLERTRQIAREMLYVLSRIKK